MSISQLPTELILKILEEVDCPQDLYSLILASEKCYEAFQMGSLQILTSVINNAFLPNALHHALALRELSSRLDRQRAAQVEGDDGELWPDIVERTDFQTRYWGGTFEFPTDRESINSLCRLATQISWFITLYCKETMEGLYGTNTDWVTSNISSSERTRLQRAFLRLDLYAKMRVADNRPTPPIRTDIIEQFYAFFGFLYPWEVEEMNTVFRFIHVKMNRLHRSLNTNLIRQVCNARNACFDASASLDENGALHIPSEESSCKQGVTESKAEEKTCSVRESKCEETGHQRRIDTTTSGDEEPKGRAEMEEMEEMVYFAQDMNEKGLGFYTKRGAEYATFLSALGLDLAESWLRSDANGSRITATLQLYADIFGPTNANTFISASEFAEVHSAHPFRERFRKIPSEADDTLNANYGWTHFKTPSQGYITIWSDMNMRQTGYVFWDYPRIRSPVLWGKLLQAVAHDHDDDTSVGSGDEGDKRDKRDEESQYFDRYGNVPQIQCFRYKIPRDEMDRILETFALPPDLRPWDNH